MKRLTVTQAGVTALAITIIGQVVALVPSLSPEKESLISTSSVVIAAVFALLHAAHALIALVQGFLDHRQAVSLAEVSQAARTVAQDEIGKVDLTGLAQEAIEGQNIGELVKTEARLLLAPLQSVLGQQAIPVPPAAAPEPPVVPPPAV